jgi:hypothetical protein
MQLTSFDAARRPATSPKHGEREVERVGLLPDRDDLVERLVEDAPAALAERLPAEGRKRLRGAEPLRGAADEEDPGRPQTTRHGSE